MREDHGQVFRGKAAIVTGATRGIGRAIALALAARGADVVINHRDSARDAADLAAEIERLGSRAVICQADLADRGAARDIVAHAMDGFGRLDILVNNAGISHLQRLGEPSDWAAADRLWAVNTFGVIDMIRAAAEVIADDGRILTIGSVSASLSRMPGAADYCGSKAALAGYTRGAAHDLGHRRVTVNLIESGMMTTDMALKMSETDRARIKGTIPLGRFGDLVEMTDFVCFLASPASSYITGATLTIDGGSSA